MAKLICAVLTQDTECHFNNGTNAQRSIQRSLRYQVALSAEAAQLMSAERREKFQDSNALIQLSRQLRSKQASDSAAPSDTCLQDPSAKLLRASSRAGLISRKNSALLIPLQPGSC